MKYVQDSMELKNKKLSTSFFKCLNSHVRLANKSLINLF